MSRRRIAALVSVAAILICAAAAATSAALAVAAGPNAAVGAVHWEPDYNGKKITVTVDLTFFANCPDAGTDSAGNSRQEICRQATEVAAGNIVDDILADWNGHKYKCWPFIVKITKHVVDDVSQLPANSVPILLDWSPSGPVRAYTSSTGNDAAPGDISPGDGPRPTADPDDPSKWPAAGKASDYTHEFGHVLGLDDNYDVNAPTDKNGLLKAVLVPGQSDDAMYSADAATAHLVSENMINEVVERSGKVDTSKVKCAMTIDSGPTDLNLILLQLNAMTLHLYTCDYTLPSSDPKHPTKPMHFKGFWSASGSIITVHGSGTFPVEFDTTIPPNGGTMSFEIHGANWHSFTVTGRASWNSDGLLHVDGPWDFNGATTAIFNPPFDANVTAGAKQCPQ